MRDDFDLIADIREDQGKGASRRLRHSGMVPAIIYGAGRPPRALAFDHNRVVQQLENEKFYSSILEIKVGDKSQSAILKAVQRHPSKPQIMHLDFQRIVADEEIKMLVPVHFLGEDVALGVKEGGGKVQYMMTEVEVVCLPKHLPEYLELDITELELDDMLKLSDIPLPEGVSIPALAQGEEADRPVVSIHVIKEVVIEEPEELEEGVEPGAVPVGDEEAPAAEDAGEEPTEE
ncbi:MAG: 50S ribosomal protein L25/general stress protein Ctc [Gammaproteobacteria bacterium]|nr:50S ribosomal protein L25/general stress protein Ctc [Gammaproteobacteria bacterium]MBT8105540.1 50S ribosomal protein L25/general stress protein Ctc [Gammaproteobacteria bacterium]NNF50337.1 50S ribosomal protein L25/general stress protein Ctc [Woeseiaceae bacterium]NNK25554.1 50S ribosomal protein L25/general stress protein Ctc [Woeseiaceae bacterium]